MLGEVNLVSDSNDEGFEEVACIFEGDVCWLSTVAPFGVLSILF